MFTKIEELLKKEEFITTGENYFLTRGNSSFSLTKEKQITERYTAMEYTITTTSGIFLGLIYTNDLEHFNNTLNRLKQKFNQFSLESERIEKVMNFIQDEISSFFMKVSKTEYVFSFSKNARYHLFLKENLLGFEIVKKTENSSFPLGDMYFTKHSTQTEIINEIQKVKNYILNDSKTNIIPFGSVS